MKLSAVLLLALVGCYSPSYPDCVYACSSAMECPGALSCVEGMCSASTDSCANVDGGIDVPPDSAPRPATCANGTIDYEFCPGQPEVVADPTAFTSLHDAQVADVNGDGTGDLLYLAETATPVTTQILVALGDGDATFATAVAHTAPSRATQLLVQESLGFIAGMGGLASMTFASSGDPEFNSMASHPVPGPALALTLGTFSGNTPSIAAAHTGQIVVADISAGNDLSFDASFMHGDAAGVATVRGDGKVISDKLLVWTPVALSVYAKNDGAEFDEQSQLPHTPAISSAASGNIDGIGSADIVFADRAALYYVRGDSSVMMAPKVLTRWPGADFGAMTMADLDGDGIDDVLVAMNHNGEPALLMQPGSAVLPMVSSPTVVPLAHPADEIHVGDVNGDDVLDIIVTSVADKRVSVILQTP